VRLLREPSGNLLFTASAPLLFYPGSTAVTALRLDAGHVRQIAGQVGLPVAIVPADQARDAVDDPRQPLRERALTDGEAVQQKIEGDAQTPGVYLAVRPLRDPSGHPVAVVETSLSTAPIAASLSEVERGSSSPPCSSPPSPAPRVS
jgi:hypothetical protein